MNNFKRLKREVVDVGLCTFCGTCIGICKSGSLKPNYNLEEPELAKRCNNCGLCWEVCPGRDVNFPELEKMIFGKKKDLRNEVNFGILKKCFKGYASNGDVREIGASGGVASALLMYGFEFGIIDGAIIATMDDKQPYRAVPRLIMRKEEVLNNAKSKYVSVPNNACLNLILEKGLKKVAVVGCPCHIQAIRKMALSKKFNDLMRRIVFTIGLFCGTNYYFKGTEHLTVEHLGTSLDRINSLEYRPEFKITTKNGAIKSVTSPERRLFFLTFQRDRCLMCVDFSAELADISLGGFFHPDIIRGSPGWSAIISRTKQGNKILYGAKKKTFVEVFPITKGIMLNNIGFEFKHGAIYHLTERKRHNWPVPNYHYPIKLRIVRREIMFDTPHLT